MKNFYHWLSLAAKVPYYGPTEGAVTFENGECIVVDFKSPNARQVLDEISTKGWPTASFFKVQKTGDWVGTIGRNMKDALGREVTLCGAGMTLDEAIADLNNEIATFTATKEALLANPEALLREHLRCHDWYACMSDSYAVARAGDAHMDHIKLLMAKMDKTVARSIYLEYAPSGIMGCPV